MQTGFSKTEDGRVVSQSVLYDRRGPAAWITMNRPDKLNAITLEMNDRLIEALDRASADDDVKVVVLTGSGRAFSAGHDLQEEVAAQLDGAYSWHGFLETHFQVVKKLLAFRKAIVAAVSGHCVGGGFEFALACDIIIAAEDARFGHVEIKYGSGPVTLILPFLIHEKRAREMLLTGDTLDATEAQSAGFVNHVVPNAQLEDRVDAVVGKIAPTPLPVVAMTKLAIARANDHRGLRAAIDTHIDLAAILNSAETPEQQEFDRIAGDQGLKAALAWRDSRYDGTRHADD
jgi:enoyl-CoA hydratase